MIRSATIEDLVRIAEIEVFNYRMNFYPIFKCDTYYFQELTVPSVMQRYQEQIDTFYVYDDGVVKGFMQVEEIELKKLFVEPILHSQGIGAVLLEYALQECSVQGLWALEKNVRAIEFYERHGFRKSDIKRLEDDTEEYLVWMEL
ncbi:MAG: GNAT family N-acetyltransferase [Erysipelotrichales bacterium]|nr:GNAT family N-acetyltransferase [Erysipelotrichales bacterium]